MTENMASSAGEGGRPSRAEMSLISSSLNPRRRWAGMASVVRAGGIWAGGIWAGGIWAGGHEARRMASDSHAARKLSSSPQPPVSYRSSTARSG